MNSPRTLIHRLRSRPVSLALGWWLAATMLAQDLQITRYGIDAQGRFHVQQAANAGSYYILLRGNDPAKVNTPARLALGVDGDVDVVDARPSAAGGAGFYRIKQVPISSPLDSDGDGIDDVYELKHPTVLDPTDASDAGRDPDLDGFTNLEEWRNGTDPTRADGARVTTLTTSPAPGESGVSVNRETILRFSNPLAAGTVLTPETLHATFGGRRILSRIELAADRRSAFLFYLEPLPGSARVEVTFDGTRVLDVNGQAVDADGDGRAGGVGRVAFDTVNTAAVSQTAVIGRVFASEPAADPKNPGMFINRPLEGVQITVDGMEETLRTRTDAAGNFRLEPVPAGRFFVHVDGRTAVGSEWPGGAYYPFVGKAWEAVSGVATNLAGGTGEIFLPRIVQGTLQSVSSTQDTTITFPPAVVAANPGLSGVTVEVPANALVSENGVRGGRVGIAPVAPDRLPEKLPAGLALPLVITVQTDGPGNFDRPVPVRFPNLPDPKTGQKLPPGAKSALWSFNHDTGRWEIQGPMTVTPDGNFVVSDPGIGIRQPGWHGAMPGTSGGGGPLGSPKPKCEDKMNCHQNPDFNPTDPANYNGCGPNGWDYVVPDNPNGLLFPCASFGEACKNHDIGYNTCGKSKASTDQQFHDDMLAACDCLPTEVQRVGCRLNADLYYKAVAGGGAGAYQDAQDQACICEAQPCSAPTGDEELPAPAVGRRGAALQGTPLPASLIPQLGPHRYAIINRLTREVVQRGVTGVNGIAFSQLILAANTTYDIAILQESTLKEGIIRLTTGDSGSRFEIAPIIIKPAVTWDMDGDGLHDGAELILGTDPMNPDTDGDGLLDAVEVLQGTDPLDGRPARTGILASAPTPGGAVDIAARDDVALVAEGNAGLSVFNIFNGLTPTLVAQLRPAGNVTRVAYGGGLGAAATEGAGLAVLDVAASGGPRIARQVPLGGSALSVAVAGNLAFVGLGTGEVASVDMLTGTILQRVRLSGPVWDVAIGGDTLLALTDGTLHTLSLDGGEMTPLGSVGSPYPAAPNRRLFATPTQAYAVHGKGYNTFDIANPASPRLLAAGNTAQFGWKQLVLNGSGVGLAASSPVLAFENPATHNVSMYDTRDPLQTDRFLATFVTPGFAQAVAIYNGLAYVADGDQGIQVVNYQAFDALGKAPTIQLRTGFAEGVAEEGKLARLSAEVGDDVQVRNVEFYVDGVKVGTDGNYPFEHRFVTPVRTATKKSFTVQAIASDTGGNRTTSSLLTIQLVSDATPPRIRRLIPADGSGVIDARRVGAYFSEPIDPAGVTPDTVFVLTPGPDGVFGTADDQRLPGGAFRIDPTVNGVSLEFPAGFATGAYQLVIRGLRDLAGNPIGAESRSLFTAGVGLTGEYFDNIDFTAPVLTRVDGQVDFDWGGGSPDPLVGPDQFSVRWRGSVVPPTSGLYTFYTVSDDGVRLWVDGEMVVQNWGDHGTTENAGTPVTLVAGRRHEIQMEMYENGGGAVARLLWSGPDVPKQVIPSSNLLPYEDQRGPRLLLVLPDPSYAQVTLRFSEALEPGSAETPSNYSLNGGVTVTRAILQPNRTDVVLTTSRQAEATRYVVTVQGVRDASDRGNLVDADTRLDFTTHAVAPGVLRREVYYNIPGFLVSDLTASPRFPHSPDQTDFVSSFEAPSNFAESYGQRLSGWLTPPATGDYVFYIAADDQGQLFLSSDDSPANKRLIAGEPGWNSPRYWVGNDRRDPNSPENRSAPVRLEANRRYYVEALHKETFGGDNLGVTWQFLGDGSQMFIEAEDVDFGGGKSLPGATTGLSGPYAGGAYAGLGTAADAGIDWGTTGGDAGQPYRPGTGIAAGKLNQHPDGLGRGSFTVQANYVVGWNDSGDWYNYTRTFPTPARSYAVYGRLSSGGAAIQLQLDAVTAGVGTPDQTLKKLGQFRPGRSTGNWDVFDVFPLVDDAGVPTTVQLGGVTTLRLTTLPNSNGDIDYLVFVPATTADPGLPLFRVPANGSEPIPGRYLSAYYAPDGRGQIHREVYRDIPGAKLSDLLASPKYPDLPDERTYPTQLEAPRDYADYYGQRLSGYILPPITGEYTFYMAADDEGAFFLSTDETPANLRLAASEPIWSNFRAWSTFYQRNPDAPENRSQRIRLEAGRRYYFEALQKEIYGGDHLGVTWRLPGELSAPDGAPPIPGAYLATLPAAAPTTFLRSPANTTVDEEGSVTLTARVTGVPPFTYRWLRDGKPIEGATSFTYTLPRVAYEDDKARFTLEARGLSGTVTSAPAVVSVLPDTTAPKLLGAQADRLDRVVLTFSEALDRATASDAARYSLSAGLLVTSVSVSADATRVSLGTSPLLPAKDYTVQVTGVTDDAHFRNVIAPGSSAAFRAPVIVPGGLQREVYRDVGGGSVADLTASAKYPNLPGEVGTVTLFETPSNVLENYGVRLSGYVTPPVSGDYLFYMASDDGGALWLSTDEAPANKRLIASEPIWNGSRYWVGTDRRNPAAPENVSAPIPLVAGRRYYVEALMKEGGGGDSLAVTWQLASSFTGSFVIEAEDFDTGGGQHPAVADTMPYAGGAFSGLPAVSGVDYFDPGFSENDDYRRSPSSQLFGSARTSNGEVQLTPNAGSQQGSLILAPTAVTGPRLDVSFDLYIGDGSAADGFSFNFGDLPDASFGEQGAGAGLRVELDTWNNGSVEGFDDEANTIEVWYGNTRVGKAANIQLRTASYVPVRIQHDGNTLKVTHNDVVIFENLVIPGWNPQPNWRLGWGARTGGATDRHLVRNLNIVQPPTVVPPFDDPGVGIYAEPGDRMRYGGQPTVTNDWGVGWLDKGDWMNYTRKVPAGEYYALARAASGAAPVAASLGRVSGAGTAQQTVTDLGTFSAPNTGSWSTYVFVPLRDAAGQWVKLSLGGTHTFRFTMGDGNANLNYLLLVPTSSIQVPPPGVQGPGLPLNGSAPIDGAFLSGYGPAPSP